MTEEVEEEEEEARLKGTEEEIEAEEIELGWVKELDSKVIDKNIEKEKDRFCEKFELSKEDLSTSEVRGKPYIRLESEVSVLRGRREVKITNRPSVGDKIEDVEFGAESREVAEALAEIFDGEEKKVAMDGDAYLVVEADGDTIEVAQANL